jgi:hypothetical protein
MGDSVGLKGSLTVYFSRVWCPRGSNSVKTSLGSCEDFTSFMVGLISVSLYLL